MNNKILYTNNGNLEKQIKTKKIIPYMIYPNEIYKKNKWYFSFYYNIIFKIIDVDYNKDGSLNNAFIQSDDGNRSMICTELDFNEDYSVSKDRRSIYKTEIINSQESFTGAEIIYWFFINDIDCFNLKYQEFWKFVDRYSPDRVIDRERYFITAKLIAGKYTDCRLIKDNNYNKHQITIDNNTKKSNNDDYMAKLKKYDMNRMVDKHKKDYQ